MARANTYTLLPLDTFFKIIGLHPLHGNQVEVADLAPALTCGQPLVQFAWQYADRVGREEIALAIKEAEDIFALHLGYEVAPRWVAAERVSFTKPSNPDLTNVAGIGSRGYLNSVRTHLGEVISGGVEAHILLDDAVVITYSDADSDGYSETATCTVSVPDGATPDVVAAYYPGKSGANEYEIRPINVSIVANTATITMRREQLVKLDLQEGLVARSVDGLNNANFLTTLDFYLHFNDPQLQTELLWERTPNMCGCLSDDCANCGLLRQRGDLVIRNPRLGIVVPRSGDWNATTQCFDLTSWSGSRQPDHARLWYYAGQRDFTLIAPNITIPQHFATAISYLALTLLDRPLCSCNNLDAFTKHWSLDLAYQQASQAVSTSFKLSSRLLDNPIGTTRAAINAWQLIERSRVFDA